MEMRPLCNNSVTTENQFDAKLAIYAACVIPVLLCSAEAWTLESSDWRRVDAFHHRCQRHILQTKVYDHVSDQEDSSWTGLSSIGDIRWPPVCLCSLYRDTLSVVLEKTTWTSKADLDVPD